MVRWLDDVATCESCTPADVEVTAQRPGPAIAATEMPEVRRGDILDLIEPERNGYLVGTNWDSPAQWKNPKAARRIVRIWRLVWSKDGTE